MRLPPSLPRFALGAGLAAAGLTGCLNSDNATGPNTTTVALIRIVQAAPDTSVDIALGGSAAASAVPFGVYVPTSSATCSYFPYCLVATPTQLTFAAAGSSTPFYNQVAPEVASNGVFTIITLGHTKPGAAPAATVSVIADTTGVATTLALFRVFNAVDYVTPSATGNPVDVYIHPQGAARPTTPDVASLVWGRPSGYISKTPGNFQVDVFSAGAASTGTPLFTATLTVGSASVRTLVLQDPPAGAIAGTPGSVVVLSDQY